MERGLFGVFIRVRILSPGADGHGESVLCGPAGPDSISSVGGSAMLRIEVRKNYVMKNSFIISAFCRMYGNLRAACFFIGRKKNLIQKTRHLAKKT